MAVLTWCFLPSHYWKEVSFTKSPELSIPIELESFKCKFVFVSDQKRWLLQTNDYRKKSILLKVSSTPGGSTSSYLAEFGGGCPKFVKVDRVSGLVLSKFIGLVDLDFNGEWPPKEVMFSVDGAVGDCKITSGIRMCTHTMVLKKEDTALSVQKTFSMHTNLLGIGKMHSFNAEMKADSDRNLEILIGGYDDYYLDTQSVKLWLLDASGKEIYSGKKDKDGQVDGKDRFYFDDAMINSRSKSCLSPELTLKIHFFMVEMVIISDSGLLFNPPPSDNQQLKEKETCIDDVSDLCRILKTAADKSMAIEWLAQHEREVITSEAWKQFIDSNSRLAAEALNAMCLKKLAPPTKLIKIENE